MAESGVGGGAGGLQQGFPAACFGAGGGSGSSSGGCPPDAVPPVSAPLLVCAAVTDSGRSAGSGSQQQQQQQQQRDRIALRKAQLRGYPRTKKLEKLGVYSACKAEESCKCNGWKNRNPPPTPPRVNVQQTAVSLAEPCRSCGHTLDGTTKYFYRVRHKMLE